MTDVFLPQRNDVLGKAMSMKQFMDSRALNAEQLKQAQLQNQQAEQATADDQAYREVMSQYGDDPVRAIPELMRRAPRAGMALVKTFNEQQKAAAEQHKAALENEAKELSIRGQILSAATDQNSWSTIARPQLAARMKPEDAAKLPEAFDPKQNQAWIRMGMDAKDRVTADHNAFQEALEGKKFDYQQKNDEVNRGVTVRGQDLTAKSAEVGHALTAKGQEQRAAQAAERLKLERQRVGMERERLNRDSTAPAGVAASPSVGVHGDEYLKTLGGNGEIVKALADGRMQFPTGRALQSNYWQGMLRSVAQYDPSFDATNYGNRAAVRREFTGSGSAAKSINALNTVIGHLGEMSEKADKLNNTGVRVVNKAKNWVAEETGDADISNFKAVRNSVADELVRAWRGSGGSEADIQARLKDLDTANSPAQLHGVISELTDLLGSKLEAFQDQYRKGMGKAGEAAQMLSPKSVATVNKLRAKVGKAPLAGAPAASVKMKAPDGTVADVPADQVAHYEQMGAKRL